MAAPAAPRTSNPPLLGVQMNDYHGPRGLRCVISKVTKGTGAEAAGLREGDELAAIDGAAILTCNELVAAVQARDPHVTIKVDVFRNNVRASFSAELLPRDEVLRRRLVGQPVPAADLISIDDETPRDLGSLRARTTIVGWFSTRCANCDAVISKVARWSRDQDARKVNPLYVVAATGAELGRPLSATVQLLKARHLDVPVLVADPDTYEEMSIDDGDRVHFMVIDCRGVVQYAAPIVPGAEDAAAALDELYAAAEQAARPTRAAR